MFTHGAHIFAVGGEWDATCPKNGEIDKKEKQPGGERREAANDDLNKKGADWADRVVQIEPLKAHLCN